MEYKTLREHIKALALHHGINIVWMRHASHSYANWEKRNIQTLRIRGLLSYSIALHELGHVVTAERVGWFSPPEPRGALHLTSEMMAWQWARENALLWTRPMHLTQRYCLRSYRPRWDRMALAGAMSRKS